MTTDAESSDDTEQETDDGEKSAQQLAQEKEEETEQAEKEMSELEDSDDLPQDMEDWPSGPAKYETFGKDDASYGEGPTSKLGPANLERHADGSVSIDGKKVDNPDDYKGEPIVSAVDKAEKSDSDDGEDKDEEKDGEKDEENEDS